MYVESRPVSKYPDTEGWKMPSPQPMGTLKRPPIIKNGSSSPSLKGMEQTVPSFQSFLKRTPPPDQQKPLPPTPLQPRRPSSFDSASSRPPSSLNRRSSSVYSRTVSQWDPDWYRDSNPPDVPALPSWRSIDFADHSTLLRPIAYSRSTSELLEKPQTPQLLEARTYRPLITTPSPTISRRTTPSPPPQTRPSVLLPPPPAVPHVPRQHLRTVSLEKAKELMQAPGAVHLLPEELRAQTLGKSRSQEPMRLTSMDMFAGKTPPELPASPTLIDNQGRERLLSSPTISNAPSDPGDSYIPSMWSPVHAEPSRSFHVGTGPVRTMAPVASQPRQASREKASQALGLGDADESRGRTRTRGPRNMSYDHYIPQTRGTSEVSERSAESPSDAQKIAQEYHSLLNEQYRQASDSPASNVSDTELGTHMKMVPQPLFQGKPAAGMPGETNSRRSSQQSVSPFSIRADSGLAGSMQRRSSASRGSFPLRLSLTPYPGHQRRSTSGSIPISPPSASLPKKVTIAFPPKELEVQPRKQSTRRRASEDLRVSLYYPHVMTRKNKNEKSGRAKGGSKTSKSATGPLAPPLPMLAADIIAQRLKTPEITPDSSPLRSMPPYADPSSRSDAASVRSDRSGRPLHQRFFKGAARYADKIIRPASPYGRKRSGDSSRALRVASPESPHLLPSPVSTRQPPAVHLGWSDHAKTTFDRVRSSVQPHERHPEALITHVTTPAKPLDDSRAGLAEPESPGRKGSIFGGLMEGWRESKAEKRREDLKKVIKVVTPAAGRIDDGEEARPVPGRRMSAFGWM
ncbi:hypothetical protein LTR85_001955 [Meristemomyces frigidus]|nr:hypothetical protein LTR85_001955 [Meristemomyces frigidus]